MTTITVSGSSNNSNLVLGSTGASINDSGAVPAVVPDTHLDNINSALTAFGFDVQFSGTFNPYKFPEITTVATPQMVGTYIGTEINKALPSGTETLTAVVSEDGVITFQEIYWTIQIEKTEIFNTKHLALVNLSKRTPIVNGTVGPHFLPWLFQHLNGDTANQLNASGLEISGNPTLGNITSSDGWFVVFIFDITDNSFKHRFVYTGIEGDWAKLELFFDTVKQYPNYVFESNKFVTISKQLETAKFSKQ